jgi:hypothetical protein
MTTDEGTISIPLTLSPTQMSAVYREIVNIRFFDYQSDFKRVAPRPGGEISITSPSTTYRLEVRSVGMTHTVTYDDLLGPRSEEADRLLNLFKMIDGVINDFPEVKRLPPLRFHCL